jgi:SPP1 gp7 family putative phage head morphogenesis protein
MVAPRLLEREYRQRLFALINLWREEYLRILDPHLEKLAREARPAANRLDGWTDEFGRLMDTLRIGMDRTVPSVKNVSLDIAGQVSIWNQRQWRRTVRAMIGIEVYTREPKLNNAIEGFGSENVALIRKLSDETRGDIEGIVTRGFRTGTRVETIRKQVLEGTDLQPGRFRKTRTRAELIARDQVNKLNGQMTEMRQEELGIEQYFWRTSQDERVRKTHEAMNGKLCRWDDPTVYKNSTTDRQWKSRASIGGVPLPPGEDYQCRCYAEADMSSLLEEAGII